jgi:hypothetical protein
MVRERSLSFCRSEMPAAAGWPRDLSELMAELVGLLRAKVQGGGVKPAGFVG